jgi:organic radical activating enzyme
VTLTRRAARPAAAPTGLAANLVEIFSSIQGEGPCVGQTTLFFRFGECDLRCAWCDSPDTWKPARRCRVEAERGSGRFDVLANPVDVATALAAADRLFLSEHRYASFTGGEPLLQPEPLLALATGVRERGVATFLETHGLHARALERVIGAIDFVSMDWKLASDVVRAGEELAETHADFPDEHEAFLRVASSAPALSVKLVITPASGLAEIDEAARRIAALAPDATLVLQPVTPAGRVRTAPRAERMLELGFRLSRVLKDVRVIPQTHKVYGAL